LRPAKNGILPVDAIRPATLQGWFPRGLAGRTDERILC